MRDAGRLSQTEAVETTGLQPSTVYRIFGSLEQQSLIEPTPKTEVLDPVDGERRGRKPTYFSLNRHARYFVGAELSGTGVTAGIFDFRGDLVHHVNLLVRIDVNGTTAIQTTADAIRRVIFGARIERSLIEGIGIGVPGVVDLERGTVLVYERFTGMNGVPIEEKLMQEFEVPVIVHNNAAVITLYEAAFGKARHGGSAIAFLIRAGIGGAYVDSGRIVENHGQSVFEIGHLYTDITGTVDEVENSPRILEDLLNEEILMSQLPAGDRSELENSILTGDGAIRSGLETSAGILAGIARNVSLLLSPEVFLIITRYEQLSQYLARGIRARFESVEDPIRLGVKRIEPVAYNSLHAARGAAELVYQRYFGTDRPAM